MRRSRKFAMPVRKRATDRRLDLATLAIRFAILGLFAACPAGGRAVKAQSLESAAPSLGAPQVDRDASIEWLTQQLERQQAEIATLQSQLLDLKSVPAPFDPVTFAPAVKNDESAQKAEPAKSDSNSKKWTVKLGGHVQTDYITWAKAAPSIAGAQNYFEFRRLRLVADGTGYDVFDFRLQMTLEPETVGESPVGLVTAPDVKDAYLSMNEIPWLGRFRIGNFFVPFSLEQVTNDTNNIFLERSIPTQGVFAMDRELGVAFYNATEDKRMTWTWGAFFDNVNDAIKERIDDNQGIRLSGRVTWLPYYDEASNGRYLIHTGAGVLHTDDNDDRVRFRARPQIHEGPRLIDSGNLAADKYTTGNLELAVVCGRVTVQSEAFGSIVDIVGDEAVHVQGAYLHVSYFITGENRVYERFGQHGAQFGRNVPYNNFLFTRTEIGPGAWELKARWSNLDLSDVNRGQYNDFTVGLNWYWTDRIRGMFDWIHPMTSSEAVFGSTTSDILAMRFDFNW